MDIARGGNFTKVPAQGAWYTYYGATSDYSTEATEIFTGPLLPILVDSGLMSGESK